MKKIIFVFSTLLSLFIYSCDKEKNYELTECIPGIEGTWKWNATTSTGTFVWIADNYDVEICLIFEEGNLLSVKKNDEILIYQEELKVTKPTDIPQVIHGQTPANEYLIELSKKVRNAVEKDIFFNEGIDIIVDGYVSVSVDEYDGTMLTIRGTGEGEIMTDALSRYVR
mgnify:FL=1